MLNYSIPCPSQYVFDDLLNLFFDCFPYDITKVVPRVGSIDVLPILFSDLREVHTSLWGLVLSCW